METFIKELNTILFENAIEEFETSKKEMDYRDSVLGLADDYLASVEHPTNNEIVFADIADKAWSGCQEARERLELIFDELGIDFPDKREWVSYEPGKKLDDHEKQDFIRLNCTLERETVDYLLQKAKYGWMDEFKGSFSLQYEDWQVIKEDDSFKHIVHSGCKVIFRVPKLPGRFNPFFNIVLIEEGDLRIFPDYKRNPEWRAFMKEHIEQD